MGLLFRKINYNKPRYKRQNHKIPYVWSKNLNRIFTTTELKRKVIYIFLFSTASFVISWLLIYILYQGATIFTARLFHIPVVWYYYRVKFPLLFYSSLYSRSHLIFIFSSGPLISLFLAFIFKLLFYSRDSSSKNFKLFYLWGMINGLNMFFGSYIVGVITRTEFIYTSEWILMNNPFDIREMIIMIIFIIIMLVIGFQITSMFLVSSGSMILVTSENRPVLILFQIILPWIAGVMIFFLVMIPKYYLPFHLKTITPLLFLIPSLFTYNSSRNEIAVALGRIHRTRFRWWIIIGVAVILVLYRVALNFGIRWY